ncbi:MAG: hydroxyacid dehydrogenase [Lachnospiraceae bacterium]|nr:hydroxyacid dehydrogenase [Lachnospiraceae bacterium]
MAKVLITPRSFAQYSKEPLELLEKNGIEIIKNPTGAILKEAEMLDFVKDVEGIIVGVDPLDKSILENAPKLKAIAKYGVGTDNIDLDYCEEKGIKVSITLNANSSAVSDYAFSLMLAAARRLVEIDKGCRKGDWSKKTSIDVYGKKLGILGLGHIGRGLCERAKGFQMEVYAYDIYKDEEYIKSNHIKFTSVEEIFKECDFISVHLPLTDDTRHMIDEKMLEKAKKNLVIVNTARGGIIDEDALYQALKNGTIYGAGIDVFEEEPPENSKLLTLENVVAGAHSAASTIGAVDKMSTMAAENIVESLKEKGVL